MKKIMLSLLVITKKKPRKAPSFRAGSSQATGFRATNLNDREVVGAVCSGLLFKNATVRF